MKFIIDAHLPASLKQIFEQNGYDVIHTLDLPLQNDTQDEEINRISAEEQRIVITKGYKTFRPSKSLRLGRSKGF